MKNIIAIVFLGVLCLPLRSSAQTASINKEGLSFLKYENTMESTEPERRWPICEKPLISFVNRAPGFTEIFWDIDLDKDGSQYEISIEDRTDVGNRNSNNIVKTKARYIQIPEEDWLIYSDPVFKIRRICEAKNAQTIYSDWEVLSLSVNICFCSNLDANASAEFRQEGKCLFVVTDLPCSGEGLNENYLLTAVVALDNGQTIYLPFEYLESSLQKTLDTGVLVESVVINYWEDTEADIWCDWIEADENNQLNLAAHGFSSTNCHPSTMDPCLVVDYIGGSVQGQDVLLETFNINQQEFYELISNQQISKITLDIFAENSNGGYESVTIDLYDAASGSYDISTWNHNLSGFAIYDNITVSAILHRKDVEDENCSYSNTITIVNSSIYCDVFDLLLPHTPEATGVTFNFNDPDDNDYLVISLQDLGYNYTEIEEVFQTEIDHSIFTLSYSNGGAYNTETVFMPSFSNTTLEDIEVVFEGVDQNNFSGSLQIEIFDQNGNIHTCLISPITLETSDPNTNALPDYECNQDYTLENVTNTTPISTLNVGDLLNVGGFSFIITHVSTQNDKFFGEGLMAHPFADKALKVEFPMGIKVNEEYQVFEGIVLGVKGDPAQYPGFNVDPDTITIGDDICQVVAQDDEYDEDGFDPVTGLNARGFGRDSIHSETNTRYDENGFDINGEHENGTEYNDDGCNVEGFTEDDIPCDPSGQNDPIVTDFINENTVTLPDKVPLLVDGLIDSINAKLALLDCGAKRTELDGLINSHPDNLNYKYIIGENKEYLNKEMSEQFISEPKPVVLNTINRDPKIIEIEEKHIELYTCDKLEITYTTLLYAIESVGEAKLIQKLEVELKRLTKYQVEKFKDDPAKFDEWLLRTLTKIIENEAGLVYNEASPKINFQERSETRNNDYSSAYYSLASLEDDRRFYGKRDLREEAFFLFNQGFKDINGVNRGFYLEELHSQMQAAGGGEEEHDLLPLKIEKILDGDQYDIYLDNISLSPAGALLDAYFIYEDPGSGKKLVFQAHHLSFGTGGVLGSSRLSLQTMIEIRLSNSAKLVINPSIDTYVSWDCSGFTGMGIDGAIELCREMVVPLHPITMEVLPDPERYRLDFTIQLEKWSDFYLSFNEGQLNPFALADNTDIKITAQGITVDFSDYRSPVGVQLPQEYTSPHYANGSFLKSWRGFYMKELSATLPNHFSSDDQEVTVGVEDLIIDGNGVSGLLFGENILNMEDGNLGGWPFSIDYFELLILKNRISGGGLGGQVNVPVFEGGMHYDATVHPNNRYEFIVTPNEIEEMDLFLADVKLFPNSMIQVKYTDGEILAKATLNGKLDVKNTGGAIDINFPEVSFQNFEIQNKAPYFSPGTWQIPSNISADVFGFGVNISDIKPLDYENGDVGLGFNLDLSLVDSLKINAGGSLGIVGHLEVDSTGRQDWNFDRVAVDKFYIDTEFSAGYVKGYLQKFDTEPIYGTGFQGFVEMQFNSIGNLQAMALFGNTQDADNRKFKYFFVDAKANLGFDIPAGPLAINGFAGGVSYHMDQVFQDMDLNSEASFTDLPDLGGSLSGVTFIPNIERGLGLRAGALISTTSNKAIFNGEVTLEMLFNSSEGGGGLHHIGFNGIGQFMSLSPINNNETEVDTTVMPNIEASLAAHLRLSYNFDNKEFMGKFNVFLDTPGHLFTGAGDNYKMVDAEVYFGPQKWYIYIGTPSDRCGINFSLPVVGNVKLSAYLDVGSEVPNMPPLPSNVREIAYKVKPNQTFRNSGAGFVFGADLRVNANMDFGIVSGKLDAGLGFDLMMRHFEGAYCLGNQPYEEIGINGWYALGQMWAYLEGELDILGINVLSAGVAAALQAQLPNPFFAQATVGVRIKVLFGSFRKSFKVALGDHCVIAGNGSNELGIEVIADINPITGTESLPVDYLPEVYFNIPLNEGIELMPLGGSQMVTYKGELKSVELTSAAIGTLGHTIEYINDNRGMVVRPHAMFYAGDSVTMKVTVEIFKDGTSIATESKETSFTVGKAYDYIPASNVAYSYPLDGMYNYYKDEYNHYKGFIQMYAGMPEMFYDIPEGMDQKIRVSRNNGTTYIFDYEYDALDAKIEFPMDPAMLENGIIYKLEIVQLARGSYESFTPGSGQDFDEMHSNINLESLAGLSNGNSEENNNSANSETEKVLYTSFFRVSEYNKFYDKVKALVSDEPASYFRKLRSLTSQLISGEPFDQLESKGSTNTKPLISLTAHLNSGAMYNWFSSVKTNFYNKSWPIYSTNYSCEPIDYRTGTAGLSKPEKSMGINGASPNLQVTAQRYQYGYTAEDFPEFQSIFYGPGHVTRLHLQTVQDQIRACMDNVMDMDDPPFGADPGAWEIGPSELHDIKEMTLPDLPGGDYRATITYKLPNGITTSNYTINIKK